MEENARRIGHYKWVEMTLFELLGTWVAFVPEIAVKRRLAEHCYHHSFHAELWHARLPEVRVIDPEEATAPPNAEFEAFVDALRAADGEDQTIEKLVGCYRVLLPHLIAAYTYHRNATSAVTDGPTVRALELCLRDDLQEWRDGEIMIQTLVTTPEAAERAAARHRDLTVAMLAAGGVAGPGSVGSHGGLV